MFCSRLIGFFLDVTISVSQKNRFYLSGKARTHGRDAGRFVDLKRALLRQRIIPVRLRVVVGAGPYLPFFERMNRMNV